MLSLKNNLVIPKNNAGDGQMGPPLTGADIDTPKQFEDEIELHPQPESCDYANLSPRERKIADSLAEDILNNGIARIMDIVEKAVRVYVRNIVRELGVENCKQAAIELRLRDTGTEITNRQRLSADFVSSQLELPYITGREGSACSSPNVSTPQQTTSSPDDNDLGGQPETRNYANLSPREREVADGLAKGNSNKVIAWELGITEATVKVHLKSILRKLGVENRTQAALKWQLRDTGTEITGQQPESRDYANLTPSEREVADGLAKGNSNKVIARELGITEATVKGHLKSILRKFGVENRTRVAILITRQTEIMPSARSSGRQTDAQANSTLLIFGHAVKTAALPSHWRRRRRRIAGLGFWGRGPGKCGIIPKTLNPDP